MSSLFGVLFDGFAYGMLRSSHDFAEGVDAFVGKRTPEWTGQ